MSNLQQNFALLKFKIEFSWKIIEWGKCNDTNFIYASIKLRILKFE